MLPLTSLFCLAILALLSLQARAEAGLRDDLPPELGLSQARWSVNRAVDPAAAGASPWGSLQIVSMPSSAFGSQRARPQRALRLNSAGLTRSLREIGLPVSQCQTLARMPSRLRSNGGGINLQLSLTLSLSCRY